MVLLHSLIDDLMLRAKLKHKVYLKPTAKSILNYSQAELKS